MFHNCLFKEAIAGKSMFEYVDLSSPGEGLGEGVLQVVEVLNNPLRLLEIREGHGEGEVNSVFNTCITLNILSIIMMINQ
jgi:hypothetical protein